MTVRHLCIGSLALNDTVYADGRTSMADPGGNALYAAVGANLWSDEIGIVAVVGYDWPRDYTTMLNRSSINTTGLLNTDEETLRAWTIYEASGFRRYFSRNTEVVLLTPSPFSASPLTQEEATRYSQAARRVHMRNSPSPNDLPASLHNVDSIHICPMRMETIMEWVKYLEKKPSIFVSVDILPYPSGGYNNLNDPDLTRLLRRVDAFLPSEAEANSIMPRIKPEKFCRKIAQYGPQIVAVKLGDHGAVVYDRERDFFCHIQPYPADVDDLTGAGDSFCGGFTIGYLKTNDAVQATMYGTVSASFVIEGFGGLHTLTINRAEAQDRLVEIQQLNQHVTYVTPK